MWPKVGAMPEEEHSLSMIDNLDLFKNLKVPCDSTLNMVGSR